MAHTNGRRARSSSRKQPAATRMPAREYGPTIRDVAAVAGVSRGTVSRVLNGGHYVSPHAVAAVQRAIRETGYVVNHSARSLATRRTNCVAFLLSEPQEKLFEDPNFDVLLRSAAKTLAESDWSLTLMIAGEPSDNERIVRYLQGGHVDGVLLVSTHEGDALLDELPRVSIPLVSCGRPFRHDDIIPYAGSDNRGGGQQMARHLLKRGRTRVATISGPLDVSSGLDRLRGYQDVMQEHGLPERVVSARDYGFHSGEVAMEELLRAHPELDAVFVASDLLAAGALVALRRHGRRVPDDVALGGFDDSRIAPATDPPLTTVRQPVERIAQEMARLLLGLIQGQPSESVVLPTKLIERGSA